MRGGGSLLNPVWVSHWLWAGRDVAPRLDGELLSSWGKWGKLGSRCEPWVGYMYRVHPEYTNWGPSPPGEQVLDVHQHLLQVGWEGWPGWGAVVEWGSFKVDVYSSLVFQLLLWRQSWRILSFIPPVLLRSNWHESWDLIISLKCYVFSLACNRRSWQTVEDWDGKWGPEG